MEMEIVRIAPQHVNVKILPIVLVVSQMATGMVQEVVNNVLLSVCARMKLIVQVVLLETILMEVGIVRPVLLYVNVKIQHTVQVVWLMLTETDQIVKNAQLYVCVRIKVTVQVV